MAVIDSHQHYWETGRTFRFRGLSWVLGAVTYGWKQAGLQQLDRDFLPADLEPQISAIGCDRTVLVQALNNLDETRWGLELAGAHESIAGVVGWIDLTQPVEKVQSDLDGLRSNPKLCGIRYLVEFEADDDWLLRPAVVSGLGVLERTGVPYDLLLRPRHLSRLPALSAKLSGLDMVIDHIAKPNIKRGVLEPWRRDLRLASENPRVLCKLSGMITEADVEAWKPDDLTPYVEAALEAFGTERVMFGSDWPVSTLAGSYDQVYSALQHALRQVLGDPDKDVERAIFHGNAQRFYSLG